MISPSQIQKKIEEDQNFYPNLIVIEKSHKRKERRTRLKTIYSPFKNIKDFSINFSNIIY